MQKENIDEDCYVLPEPDNVKVFNNEDDDTKVVKMEIPDRRLPYPIHLDDIVWVENGYAIMDNRNILRAEF